jgi:hypothetical protein
MTLVIEILVYPDASLTHLSWAALCCPSSRGAAAPGRSTNCSGLTGNCN